MFVRLYILLYIINKFVCMPILLWYVAMLFFAFDHSNVSSRLGIQMILSIGQIDRECKWYKVTDLVSTLRKPNY